MKDIILDANVISLLADKKEGKKFKREQKFYHRVTQSCKWHVTIGINRELKRMKTRSGKRELYDDCLKLMESKNTVKLPNMQVEDVLSSPDVKKALRYHNETRSDRVDKETVAYAIAKNFTLVTHDKTLANNAKRIAGLDIESFYLKRRKGESTVPRSDKGDRLD